MRLKKWEDLPAFMQNDEVRPYYEALCQKKASLVFKRIFDFLTALILLVILLPLLLILSLLIAVDSRGGVFFRQTRVTQYGKRFRIHKFRTMVADAERLGTQVTVTADRRVTRVGRMLRKCRLDELPQLLDVLAGNMTFVGTRPEVSKYVEQYTPAMTATLLLPAGITSEASILYKDEDRLLDAATDVDRLYVERVLPEKMRYNLHSLRVFGFWNDVRTMFRTVEAICGKHLTDLSVLDPALAGEESGSVQMMNK